MWRKIVCVISQEKLLTSKCRFDQLSFRLNIVSIKCCSIKCRSTINWGSSNDFRSNYLVVKMLLIDLHIAFLLLYLIPEMELRHSASRARRDKTLEYRDRNKTRDFT